MPSFKSLDEASRWAHDHEAEHERLKGEIHAKVEDTVSAAIRHVEKLVGEDGPLRQHLGAQDEQIEKLCTETEGQTPLLKRAIREMVRTKKERLRRVTEEKQFRRWVKRGLALVGGLGLLIELVSKLKGWL